MKPKNILLLVFLIICFGLINHPAFCQKTLTVGEVTSFPGEIKSGYIIVPEGTDGPEIRIPITIVNGTMDGPVLALTAGIHGYEYPPILALQRLRSQLDPKNIKGAVIMVHVVNLPSFLKRTIYYNPYDWKNQNRVFPGKIDGTMTERIAFQVTNEVLKKSDVHLDLHCGDGNEDLLTYLYYTETGKPELDRKTMGLAINFGFKVLIHVTAGPEGLPATTCANASLSMGKPALTVECGRLGRTDEEDVTAILNGCFNTLKHLNMIDGQPELLAADPAGKELLGQRRLIDQEMQPSRKLAQSFSQ